MSFWFFKREGRKRSLYLVSNLIPVILFAVPLLVTLVAVLLSVVRSFSPK